MSWFCVQYRSRGAVRAVYWLDGDLEAEPLVETMIGQIVRVGDPVKGAVGLERTPGLGDIDTAAATVLEAVLAIGARIVGWRGDVVHDRATSVPDTSVR